MPKINEKSFSLPGSVQSSDGKYLSCAARAGNESHPGDYLQTVERLRKLHEVVGNSDGPALRRDPGKD